MTDNGRDRGKSLAQIFALVVGATLVLVGLAGFIVDSSFDTVKTDSPVVDGEPLLGFEVNGWHNVVHLASGLLLLAVAPRHGLAKTGVIAFGLVYAVVAVLGFTGNGDLVGLLPINGPDKVLHTVLAIAALAAGLLSTHDRGRDHGGKPGTSQARA